MSVIICGTSKNCLCCGNDVGEALGVCWDCTSGNFECDYCILRGIPFDRFSEDKTTARLHRFSHWTDGPKSIAVSDCGEEIKWLDIGQGILVLKNCKLCWGDECQIIG